MFSLLGYKIQRNGAQIFQTLQEEHPRLYTLFLCHML